METGELFNVLSRAEESFVDRAMTGLSFPSGTVECHLLVDEGLDRGTGIIRGRGREFALRHGRRYHQAAELRSGVRATHVGEGSHLALAWDRCALAGRHHAFIGNGNLLQNPHFVGYQNSARVSHRLYSLCWEPYSERVYSCLVVWQDFQVTIEDLEFVAHEAAGAVVVDSIFLAGQPDRRDRKDEIRYATYGQRLVRDGSPVYPEQLNLSEEFYDSRHILLNPYYRNTWDFGMDQIMANPDLYRRALRGEVVTLDTRIMDQPVDREDLRSALLAKDYREGEPVPGVRGVFRFAPEGRSVALTMHLGIYPHNTIGVAESPDGSRQVQVVQFPGLSNRAGVTVANLGRYLATQARLRDAILLDNGGDVLMFRSCQDSTESFVGGNQGYEMVRGPGEEDRRRNLRMSSVLLFVERNRGDIQYSRTA